MGGTRGQDAADLRRDGVLEKLFLFLTHNDSREHVLHHTLVKVYSRPFPGQVPLPQECFFITLRNYLQIAWGMITEG